MAEAEPDRLQIPKLARARPESSPVKKARPQSAFAAAREKRVRPQSAPAAPTVFSGRRVDSAAISHLAEARAPYPGPEAIDKDWISGDWTAGWDPNPVKVAYPRWTIPSSAKGQGGFRSTYCDAAVRNKKHVPGPGAFKALRDFCEPATSENFGKPLNTRKEKRWTPRHLRSDAVGEGANKEAPDPSTMGDETDAKRVNGIRSSSCRIPRQARNANLTDLRQASTNSLPSSFHTPGPGSYTQFSCFGQPSGACRKGYLGTMPSNNPKKFGKEVVFRARRSQGLDITMRHPHTRKRATEAA
jgi:hypothetical protein